MGTGIPALRHAGAENVLRAQVLCYLVRSTQTFLSKPNNKRRKNTLHSISENSYFLLESHVLPAHNLKGNLDILFSLKELVWTSMYEALGWILAPEEKKWTKEG